MALSVTMNSDRRCLMRKSKIFTILAVFFYCLLLLCNINEFLDKYSADEGVIVIAIGLCSLLTPVLMVAALITRRKLFVLIAFSLDALRQITNAVFCFFVVDMTYAIQLAFFAVSNILIVAVLIIAMNKSKAVKGTWFIPSIVMFGSVIFTLAKMPMPEYGDAGILLEQVIKILSALYPLVCAMAGAFFAGLWILMDYSLECKTEIAGKEALYASVAGSAGPAPVVNPEAIGEFTPASPAPAAAPQIPAPAAAAPEAPVPVVNEDPAPANEPEAPAPVVNEDPAPAAAPEAPVPVPAPAPEVTKAAEQYIFCWKCGAKNIDEPDTVFCPECGSKLRE